MSTENTKVWAAGVVEALGTALEAVFEEQRDCESEEHSNRPEWHAGTAEWYVVVKHDTCGHEVVRAFCDKFKQELSVPGVRAYCDGCLEVVLVADHVKRFVRMGSVVGE